MALIQPARPEPDEPVPGRGRKVARYAVPVAVAGVAAATIGLVPALADAGNPSLPAITAEQLLTKIAASNTQTVDGSVKFTTDLGLPSALTGSATSSLFGGSASTGALGSGSSSPAAPQSQLVQLLVGTHQLHVSANGQDQQKVSIIEPAAEYSIIHNGTQLWAYDSKSNQAYHSTVPQQDTASAQPSGDIPTTPQAAAQQALKAVGGTAKITVDGTASVAGRSAYELLVTPQGADAATTTIGSFRIAVDSATGVPLKFTLTPKSGGSAVFDIGFTKVSFAKPAADTFSYKPAKGVKVTEGSTNSADSKSSTAATPTVLGQNWDSIAVVKTGAPTTAASGSTGSSTDTQSLLNSFGTKVSGSYGSGTLFHTRLVNGLLTDDGTLYVGAVTQSALTDAANAAAK